MTPHYLVFAGYVYYPQGGWADYQGSHTDLDLAHASIAKAEEKWLINGERWDWWHIVDLAEGKEISHG